MTKSDFPLVFPTVEWKNETAHFKAGKPRKKLPAPAALGVSVLR